MKKNKKNKKNKKIKKSNIIKKGISNLLQKLKLKQIIKGILILSTLILIPEIITFNSRIILTIVILISFIIIFYNSELVLVFKKTNSYFNTKQGYELLVILIIEIFVALVLLFLIRHIKDEIGCIKDLSLTKESFIVIINFFNSLTMILIALLLPAFQLLLGNIKNRIKNKSIEKRSKKETINLLLGSVLGITSLIFLFLSLYMSTLDHYTIILVILNYILNFYLFKNEIKFDDN